MISYDTEAGGLDYHHGVLPFFFAITHDTGINEWYEWDVNPFTRLPEINQQELDNVADALCNNRVIIHNAGFDIPITEKVIEYARKDYRLIWDWDNIEDSCIASHVLENLWPHSLKELRNVLLLVDDKKQNDLRTATNHARRIVRTKSFIEKHGEWRIADANDPHWPAISKAPKEKTEDVSGWWYSDTWLPRAIYTLAPEFLPKENNNDQGTIPTQRHRQSNHKGIQNPRSRMSNPRRPRSGQKTNPQLHQTNPSHSWDTVLKDYALEDSETTIVLWEVFERELRKARLWDKYQKRKQLLRVTTSMERVGVTVTPQAHTDHQRYLETAKHNETEAVKIINNLAPQPAEAPEVNIRSDKQLQKILHKTLKCPVVKKTKTGQPSISAEALKDLYVRDWKGKDPQTDKLIQHILLSRNNEKASTQLTGYRGWLVGNTIHASINITGTKFTRQSYSNPNLQNISTGKELEDQSIDYNLRECFGPPPGWKWLAYDYSNIELRIWGYLCGNKEFIWCFENDVSVHYLIACELHPELKKLSSEEVKEDKRYKRTKNGNFAIIYGASPGKADATYGVPGAYTTLSKRFPEVRAFTESLFKQVEKRGYIETMLGYRLHIPYEDPHKSVSGKVQGTAGEIIGEAMIDCHNELEAHPEYATKLILQIHDELVFRSPLKTNYDQQIKSSIFRNMEKQGEKIGIPLSVGAKEHTLNWSEGTPIERS